MMHFAFSLYINTSIVADILLSRFSGYGCNFKFIFNLMKKLGLSDLEDISRWDETKVHTIVQLFIEERFKMVLVLNKSDKAGDTDENITKIFSMHNNDLCFVSSALTECFLKKSSEEKVILYKPGSRMFQMLQDDPEKLTGILLNPSKKVNSQLNKIADFMFRFNGTGVWDAVQKCVELCEPVVVYPVRSLSTLCDANGKCLGTATVVKHGTSVRAFSYLLHQDIGQNYLYAENMERLRLGEHDPLTNGIVIKFYTSKFTKTETVAALTSKT